MTVPNTSERRADTAVSRRLDTSVNLIDLVRHDLNEIFRGLPGDAPLFAVSDLVASLGHLRQAAVLIDRAADQLEVAEVTR